MCPVNEKNNLNITNIKQYYDWNQKNSPQTLRRNNLYEYALSLIERKNLYRKYLLRYEITFELLNLEYLNNTGKK